MHARIVILMILIAVVFGCHAPKRRNAVLDNFAYTGHELLWNNYSPPGDAKAVAKSVSEMYSEYVNKEIDPFKRRQLRDDMAYRMITLIRHYHEGTADDVFEIAAALETLFDGFGIAANAVGTVGGASQLMNAVAGGLLGFRQSLNSNILAEQAKGAIVTEMAALRAAEELRLRRRLEYENDSQFNWSRVADELYIFFASGSVRDAVISLQAKASIAKQEADGQIQQLRTSERTDVVREVQRLQARMDVARAMAGARESAMMEGSIDRRAAATLRSDLDVLKTAIGNLPNDLKASRQALSNAQQSLDKAEAALQWRQAVDSGKGQDEAKEKYKRVGGSADEPPAADAAKAAVNDARSEFETKLREQAAHLEKLSAISEQFTHINEKLKVSNNSSP